MEKTSTLCNSVSFEELKALYELPLLELISQANAMHGKWHDRQKVQRCNLISIKTGGCQEDCKYCAQSSRYSTFSDSARGSIPLVPQPLMKKEEVVAAAQKAIARGAERVCLGAGWRGVRDGKAFDSILEIVKEVAALGVQVCCTLGMLEAHHLKALKEAGLYAYNHNLDSSERFYPTIITTRTYQDRLKTLERVKQAGLSVCCGGILGMGETVEDRLQLLLTLTRLDPPPDSVPINRLVPIPGTPLQERPLLSIWELVRMVAVARLTLPRAMIRLSAGREKMTWEEQALCFLSGANSIFIGEQLLTVPNASLDEDEEMLTLFGIKQ